MKVMAFDIASLTGIAFGGPGQRPLTKQIDLGQGRTDGARFAKAIRMVESFASKYKPDLIAVECPIGGKNSSQFLIGVFACVVGQVSVMQIPMVRYQVSPVRKHFIGKHLTKKDFPHLSQQQSRAEIKAIVMRRCAQLGWPVDTDDEGDAVALWDYALAKARAGQSAPSGGLFNG